MIEYLLKNKEFIDLVSDGIVEEIKRSGNFGHVGRPGHVGGSGLRQGHVQEILSKDKQIEHLAEFGISSGKAKSMINSINSYVGSNFYNIRTGKNDLFKKQGQNIEEFIQQYPKYNGDILFRGSHIQSNLAVFSNMKPGSTVSMRGLSSWSSNEKTARQFTSTPGDRHYLFIINGTSKGASISFLKSTEGEVIISRKAKFKVQSIEEAGKHVWDQLTVVNMTEIGHKIHKGFEIKYNNGTKRIDSDYVDLNARWIQDSTIIDISNDQKSHQPTTKSNKQEEQFHKFTDKKEKEFQKEINQYFDEQSKDISLDGKQLGINSILKEPARWYFDKKKWDTKLQKLGSDYIRELYEEYGPIIFEQLKYGLPAGTIAGAFDVTSPALQEFIDNYAFQFADGINTITNDNIRSVISQGMNEGLSMPKISKLVNEMYQSYTKERSLLIARTETIRASNGASVEAYRQSGVVTKKTWHTAVDDRRCAFCAPLHGKTISIEKNFFDKGYEYEVKDEQGNEMTMKLDYEDVSHPPLHPNCRCVIIAQVDKKYQLGYQSEVLGINSILKGGVGSGITGHRTNRNKPKKPIGAGGNLVSGNHTFSYEKGSEKLIQDTLKELNITQNALSSLFQFEGFKGNVSFEIKDLSVLNIPAYKGVKVLDITYKGKDANGNGIASILTIDTKSNSVHIGLIEMTGGQQNKGEGKNYINRIGSFTKSIGKSSLSLHADISIGRYAWAKLGFNADEKTISSMKQNLIKYGVKNGIKKNDSEFLNSVKSLTTMKSIAEFSFGETSTAADFSKKTGYKNKDVNPNTIMHLGKAFLTDQKINKQTDWHGSKGVS